ncbi:hypothetical protein NDU88_006889 [Pleurodeles waltl]|uniref:Uncharacterized protein n=1 Tax=Pleurodeles waltl TaxID=8319 RepID=A0AAV7WFY5_PLEWA|nr:hypothetical protein NDU88_006889 [Pleurodeles waltl]
MRVRTAQPHTHQQPPEKTPRSVSPASSERYRRKRSGRSHRATRSRYYNTEVATRLRWPPRRNIPIACLLVLLLFLSFSLPDLPGGCCGLSCFHSRGVAAQDQSLAILSQRDLKSWPSDLWLPGPTDLTRLLKSHAVKQKALNDSHVSQVDVEVKSIVRECLTMEKKECRQDPLISDHISNTIEHEEHLHYSQIYSVLRRQNGAFMEQMHIWKDPPANCERGA